MGESGGWQGRLGRLAEVGGVKWQWKVQPSYGGLLSSSCGGLEGHLGPKVVLVDVQSDNGFKGVR